MSDQRRRRSIGKLRVFRITRDTELGDTERSNAIDSAEQLWWGVNQRDAILYERTLANEKNARELFIRRNKGGIELSGVDILLALLTGYWETVEEEGVKIHVAHLVVPREPELYAWCERHSPDSKEEEDELWQRVKRGDELEQAQSWDDY